MEDDAIQTDVSPEEQQQPVLSDRELAMQAITQQLYGEPQQPQEEEAPQEEAPPAEEAATPQTVRVKIDGVEQELPLEEVIKGYQKDSVASKRLEEAARLKRELDAQAQAIAERERQIQAQTAAPADEDDGAEIQAAIDALVEGDNAAAAKYLKEAVKKGRQPATPTIDPAEIEARIKADLAAEREQQDNNRAFAEFVKENPLFAEPAEGEMHTPQRVRGDYLFAQIYGKKWENGEISYREALDQTAAHVAREFAPPTPPNPREERKKHIDNIPTASSARSSAAPKEEKVDDVLAEMRKARGQVI